MTLTQGIKLANLGKTKGYALAVVAGAVQFQILDARGNVEIEVTDWITDFEEAKALITQQ